VRNGPLAYRRSFVSRSAYRVPSPLERIQSLSACAGAEPFSRPVRIFAVGAPEPSSARLDLGTRLPINLRQFLAEQLGASLRIENDSIVALEPRSNEALMRELARAIRRFSAERAREAWCECAISIERLKRRFFASSGSVALCLRCACVAVDQRDLHGNGRCLTVELETGAGSVNGPRQEIECVGPTADSLHRAVENFRDSRTAAGLPHYDLDCYIAGGQVVFTWRPLSA
jgi:hypothetical protein